MHGGPMVFWHGGHGGHGDGREEMKGQDEGSEAKRREETR